MRYIPGLIYKCNSFECSASFLVLFGALQTVSKRAALILILQSSFCIPQTKNNKTSYWYESTWGWVNSDIILDSIIPLRIKCLQSLQSATLWSTEEISCSAISKIYYKNISRPCQQTEHRFIMTTAFICLRETMITLILNITFVAGYKQN